MPPPPPTHGRTGPAPPMPPQLQAMMRQMEQRQPKFQQQAEPVVSNHLDQGERRGGRGGGRMRHNGRGRSFQQNNHRPNRSYKQSPFKRKKGPSDDARDASRFFLPSFLENPWKALEAGNDSEHHVAEDVKYRERQHQREGMYPQQVRRYAAHDGPGRVLFQPSFLQDPWVR